MGGGDVGWKEVLAAEERGRSSREWDMVVLLKVWVSFVCLCICRGVGGRRIGRDKAHHGVLKQTLAEEGRVLMWAGNGGGGSLGVWH